MLEYICKERAYRYYFPEYHGKCKPGWLLHHKDPLWKINDPERYHQWNIEDLIPMTRNEHAKWHAENDSEFRKKMIHYGPLSKEHKNHISKSLKGLKKGPMSEEHRKKLIEAAKNRPPVSQETKNKLSKIQLEIENNRFKNKHHSSETKNALSNIFKNMKWFNNGIKNTRSLECPEGFFPGRLKKC